MLFDKTFDIVEDSTKDHYLMLDKLESVIRDQLIRDGKSLGPAAYGIEGRKVIDQADLKKVFEELEQCKVELRQNSLEITLVKTENTRLEAMGKEF